MPPAAWRGRQSLESPFLLSFFDFFLVCVCVCFFFFFLGGGGGWGQGSIEEQLFIISGLGSMGLSSSSHGCLACKVSMSGSLGRE